MNPDIKKNWLFALRSGDYEQGQFALKTNDDKFCCIGVLCDVIDPTLWKESANRITWSGHCDFLEPVPLNKIGLPIEEQSYLVGMNDQGDCLEIAASHVVHCR